MDGTPIEYNGQGGLRLAAREYPGPAGINGPGARTVLCLHGLTRNGQDFAGLAAMLQGGHRVLVPDQRGRGRSAYDPQPANYNLLVQAQDMWALLDHCQVERCAIVGTSMGALMAIVMASTRPDRIAGLVLNDAGPEIDPRGLARIAAYVGKGGAAANWDEAAAAVQAVHGAAYPTYDAVDWLRMARATYVEEAGSLRLDYDPALAQAFAGGGAASADMWPAFAVLNRVPGLLLRGDRSDILSADTAARTATRFPGLELVTVPDRGHAPDLTEPASLAAIQSFLRREDVRARW